MADGLWWLPSLLVFSVAGAALAVAVVAARRLGRRRELADLDQGRAIEVRAKGLIVEADERLRDARAEVGYAEAQFGIEASAPLRDAVARAEQRLRESFVLQQRLDDAEPDTAAERRSWSSRIAESCTSAIAGLDAAENALGARRSAERGAGETLAELAETAARLSRRRADASAALDRLGTRYAATALVGGRAALARVDAALAIAAAAMRGGPSGGPREGAGRDGAGSGPAGARSEDRPGAAGSGPVGSGAAGSESAGSGSPAPSAPRPGDAERAARAHAALERAATDLDGLDRIEAELADAERAAAQDAVALEADLAAARRERDGLADAEAAGRLGRVIGEVSAASGGGPGHVGSDGDRGRTDPFAELDRLRAAGDRLEAARAEARASQSRLDGARSALGGAIAIAESQIGVARSLIERGRGAVGASARTRLAEAERQLVIARQEPDPVAALDAARRATARAADAEALAMWDAGQR